jgi:hypothetical protein
MPNAGSVHQPHHRGPQPGDSRITTRSIPGARRPARMRLAMLRLSLCNPDVRHSRRVFGRGTVYDRTYSAHTFVTTIPPRKRTSCLNRPRCGIRGFRPTKNSFGASHLPSRNVLRCGQSSCQSSDNRSNAEGNKWVCVGGLLCQRGEARPCTSDARSFGLAVHARTSKADNRAGCQSNGWLARV